MTAIITEKVQEHLNKANWKAAITEMEKLFAIHQDPLIRVRIGDVRQKLNRKDEAIREYLLAADLFAERGFFVKARAQYRLALRLDPSNIDLVKEGETSHELSGRKTKTRTRGISPTRADRER